MEERRYKILKQRFFSSKKLFHDEITVEEMMDLMSSLLHEADRKKIQKGVKGLKSSAVREYLSKMRDAEDRKREEEYKILEELASEGLKKDNAKTPFRLPGNLSSHEDRDPNLKTYLLTAEDYR